ncbi:SH3 domain-containing protein [Amphritea balenae]|uniref:SH3 domain-containing protein n=1 Tax=Amphritea balenae TaxID=452629 RepID=A0A3P1SNC2_9GAMM|nr:SH3 domain-containing protein [Amphritea balenae]RRC98627.1 SH3 domain-containing protein [Amphritea balenae]GGK66088.1 hypothetical protein GCM10007941_15350 [Amphritea balenae]
MKWILYITLLCLLHSNHLSAQQLTSGYITATTLNVRYAPTLTSKKVGVLFLGQQVHILINQENNAWTKIITPDSGLTGWVAAQYISETPLSKTQQAKAERELVRSIILNSDDFELYEDKFLEATVKLIKSRRCRFSEVKEMQGWWHANDVSTGQVYYLYCRQKGQRKPVYLDISKQQFFSKP